MENNIRIPRDVIIALIINTKSLCGKFPYTSIKECVFFEREFKYIFLHKNITCSFDEKIDIFLYDILNNNLIIARNGNYENVLITFLNSIDSEIRLIISNDLNIIDILAKYMDREKMELLNFRKQILSYKEERKSQLR